MLSTGAQNKKKFLNFKRLRVFSFGDSASGWKLLPWHSLKRTRFYETAEVDVDSESKLLFS